MNRREINSLFQRATGMDKRGKKARMRRLADAIVAEWSSIATTKGNMTSTLGPYKRSIQVRTVTDKQVVVELPGRSTGSAVAQIARMIEFGMGPGGIGTQGNYDVRAFLLRSGTKAKSGKTGLYIDVPFKYSTKAIKQMGLRASGGGGAKSTLDTARALAPTRVRGGSWQGEAMKKGYTQLLANPNTRTPHKTDFLHGLRKMTSTQHKGTTSRFITFRRASWAGEPWESKGIEARHLAEEVKQELPKLWAMVA
jgi:hypothetical protein